MAHPYPAHDDRLSYVGKQHYSLTFCTEQRALFFTDASKIALVWTQFVRAAREQQFAITAYCFMPDHVHLIPSGLEDCSDAKAFIKPAKQYSGYYFKQAYRQRLWKRYGFERVIRDDMELASAIRYVLANPVRAGLAAHPAEYPHLGSERFTVAELLKLCEYDTHVD